jgi:hypothetical protein
MVNSWKITSKTESDAPLADMIAGIVCSWAPYMRRAVYLSTPNSPGHAGLSRVRANRAEIKVLQGFDAPRHDLDDA